MGSARTNVLDERIGDTASCGSIKGQAVSLSVEFTDADLSDTHTATVDWGDGTVNGNPPAVVISSSHSAGSVIGSHVYEGGGIYDITVSLTDGSGDLVIATSTVMITGVGIDLDGTLQVIGTNADDHVTINKQGNNLLKADADFLTSGNFKTVNAGEVQSIVIVTCGGNDHVTIAGNIDLPAVIHGGDGDDDLNGGGGRSIVIGAAVGMTSCEGAAPRTCFWAAWERIVSLETEAMTSWAGTPQT